MIIIIIMLLVIFILVIIIGAAVVVVNMIIGKVALAPPSQAFSAKDNITHAHTHTTVSNGTDSNNAAARRRRCERCRLQQREERERVFRPRAAPPSPPLQRRPALVKRVLSCFALFAASVAFVARAARKNSSDGWREEERAERASLLASRVVRLHAQSLSARGL